MVGLPALGSGAGPAERRPGTLRTRRGLGRYEPLQGDGHSPRRHLRRGASLGGRLEQDPGRASAPSSISPRGGSSASAPARARCSGRTAPAILSWRRPAPLGVGPRRRGGRRAGLGAAPAAPPPAVPATPRRPPARPSGRAAGVPAPRPRPGDVRQMSFEQPKPGHDGPASAGIQLAQATTPGPAASAIPDGPPDSRAAARSERLPRPDAVPPRPPGSALEPAAPRPDRRTPAPPARPARPRRRAPLPPAGADAPARRRPSRPRPRSPARCRPRSTPGLPLEYRILPRGGKRSNSSSVVTPDGQHVTTVTGGLILNVRNVPKHRHHRRGGRPRRHLDDGQQGFRQGRAAACQATDGETSNEVEFYLAGHVILRSSLNAKDRAVVEADELYYDARRNVAIALQSRLQLEHRPVHHERRPPLITSRSSSPPPGSSRPGRRRTRCARPRSSRASSPPTPA